MNAFRFIRIVISVALAIVVAISLFTVRATAAGRIERINESAQYLRVSLAVDFAPSVEDALRYADGKCSIIPR